MLKTIRVDDVVRHTSDEDMAKRQAAAGGSSGTQQFMIDAIMNMAAPCRISVRDETGKTSIDMIYACPLQADFVKMSFIMDADASIAQICKVTAPGV